MNSSNIATCFAPNIFRVKEYENKEANKKNSELLKNL